MKYASKDALIGDIADEHAKLQSALAGIPMTRYQEPGVWGDNWTVHDLVAHLTAWHELFLGWHRAGQRGEIVKMPAAGYKWDETPRLNRDIHREYLDIPTAEVLRRFAASHAETYALAEALTSEELLTPSQFAWTRQNSLATYLAANTASHYRFAMKVLKRWMKQDSLRP